MADPEENPHVRVIRETAEQMDKPEQNFETNFGKIASEFALLVDKATQTLDKTQWKVLYLTFAVLLLTAVLSVLAIIEHFSSKTSPSEPTPHLNQIGNGNQQPANQHGTHKAEK